jgi:signal transduction histidine kinase
MKMMLKRVHPVLQYLLIALLYFLMAVSSLLLSYQSSNATPVWPASGFALGVLLLAGRKFWVAIFSGAFAANLFYFIQTVGISSPLTSLPLSLMIAAGNTGEAVAGFMLIRELYPKMKPVGIFSSVQPVFSFFGIALATAMISASIGTAAVLFSRTVSIQDADVVWLTWWTGDISGILLVTPFIIMWFGKKIIMDTAPARVYETAALVTMVLFVSGVVFLDWTNPHYIFTRAFIIVPFLIWIAVRLRQQMVTLISVLTATIAIGGTLSGIGPFIGPVLNESMITVEVFVSVNAVMLLVLNAAILEREEKEMSLRIARDHLEQVVKTRTAQLEEKNKELERRNKDLASFGYAASHDLQEPLRKIQTFNDQLMQIQHLKENEKGILFRIRSAAARMKQLIENLLSFSRVDASISLFEFTSLQEILEEVKQDLAEKIQETDAVIETEPLPSLMVVPFQMHQLFTNLLTNAIKFRRKEITPVIKISVRKEIGAAIPEPDLQAEAQYYHICFEDNGIGFDQQYATRIFDIFQRLHGQAEYEGTGIGLAICKKIVENHKGTISASGENNHGARFHIYLPAGYAGVNQSEALNNPA